MTIKITNGGITREIESSEYGYWFNLGYRKIELNKKEELKTEPIVTETEPVADDEEVIRVKPKKKK